MKRRRLDLGLFIIFVGIFLLLNNFGLISWDFWQGYSYLWPLIFIAIGIRMIFHENSLLRILPILIIIAIPFIANFITPSNNFIFKNENIKENETYSYSWSMQEDIKKGYIDLYSPAGSIELNEINNEEQIMNLDVSSIYGKPEIDVINNKNAIEFDFETRHLNNMNINNSERWNLALNNQILWDLNIETGAGNTKLDFNNLKIDDLNIDAGAGNIKIFFGDNGGTTTVDLDTGAGNVELSIPESVGIKANFSTGIGKKVLGNRTWISKGSEQITDNYETAQTKIDITVSAGVGKIEINNIR